MKRKRFIKCIGLFLAVAILLNGSVAIAAEEFSAGIEAEIGFAFELTAGPEIELAGITEADPEPDPDPDPQPDPEPEPEPDPESESVARLYICSIQKHKIGVLGHGFLYLENLTDEPIMLGCYEVGPHEGASVGTLGMALSNGFGIYINSEAYYSNELVNGEIIGLSKELTAKKLDLFNFWLRRCNTWDPIIFNCYAFAYFMWDIIELPILIPLVIPVLCRLQMRIYGPKVIPRMFKPERDQVYRMRGFGDKCRLEIAKDWDIGAFFFSIMR